MAASGLLRAFWAFDRDHGGLDRYDWINDTGWLDVADIEASSTSHSTCCISTVRICAAAQSKNGEPGLASCWPLPTSALPSVKVSRVKAR